MISLDFPNTVKWYITGKCNLRCRHCYLTDYTQEASLEKIQSILAYLAKMGTRHVYFLGGEPLVRKDFSQILLTATKLGLRSLVASNGILLSGEKASELRGSGLRAIQISLDSSRAEIHDGLRGRGSFEKTICGIRNAKNAGLIVTLAFVASSANAEDVGGILELAHALKIDLVRIMPLVPTGTAAMDTSLRLNEATVSLIQAQVAAGRKKFPEMKIASGLSEELRAVSPGPFGCGAGTTHLIINSDLTLSACDLGTEFERTKEPVSNPEEIKTIWDHHPIFASWRGRRPSHCHLAKSLYPELPYF